MNADIIFSTLVVNYMDYIRVTMFILGVQELAPHTKLGRVVINAYPKIANKEGLSATIGMLKGFF